jgi:anti-sigma B factor antagonist
MLIVRMAGENTAIVQLPQQVDYDNASVVGTQCEDLVRQGCTHLVVDASRVEYLDSSGISMLIALSRTADAHSGALHLAAFNEHYQQIWQVLGLETLFPLHPTVRVALAAAPVSGEAAEAAGESDCA